MVNEERTQHASGQFKLRLPNELRAAIERQAFLNRRSLNSEIIICLERAVGEPEKINGDRA